MGTLFLPREETSNDHPTAGLAKADLQNAELQCTPEQAALLKKYEDYLMSIANQEMRPDLHRKFGPSDVVQQTYFRAVDKMVDFRGTSEDQFRGWLRQILLNQIKQNERDLHRDKRDIRMERNIVGADESSVHLVTSEPTDQNPTPSTRLSGKEDDERLHDCISRLSLDYQTVVKLRNWDRLSFSEIGKRMHRSPASVQKLWCRAVLKLQQEFGFGDE